MTQDIEPPTITADEILYLDDEHFQEETVCIVTGGASGIGRALSLAGSANGLTVVAADIDGEGLSETVDRHEELDLDGRIEPIEGDLRSDDDMEALVERAREIGTIRFLANIAGLQHVAPLESFPMEQYDLMQAVMVRAPVYLSKLVFPDIRAAGSGCIANMASVHGHYVTSDKVAYNVAKFAIRGLTQSIAAEGDGSIRSFSVSTGYVETPLVTGQLADTAEQRGITVDEVIEDVMLGQSRIKEMMTPIEVANVFMFGFSDHGQHLNGGDLTFDGGMTFTYE